MIETLVAGDFSELIGSTVVVHAVGPDGPATVDLSVTGVSTGTAPAPEFREPFTVSLSGPPSPMLVQETYRLDHPRLGSLELFLVPHAAGADGAVYSITLA